MSILSTAISGLLAFQRAQATTSHNIANAATEGYSRQRVELQSRTPQQLGRAYIGQGVEVSQVRRMHDALIESHLRDGLSDSAHGSIRASYAEHADRMLGDASTGLAPVLQDYLDAVQDVGNDPTAMASRAVMREQAETLVERFRQIHGLIEEQRELVNGQIEKSVVELNEYASSLANINGQIASTAIAGGEPNDLLDRRDVLLRKMAEKVNIFTSRQDDGSINVFVGTGQALVTGGDARQLVADHLIGDPQTLQIGLITASGKAPMDVTRFMTGGEMGALLETESNLLNEAQNRLGLIGLNLTSHYNAQNRLGLDVDGNLGGDIFQIPTKATVRLAPGNSQQGLADVTISDVDAMTSKDYRLSFDGSGFNLRSLPDNEAVPLTLEDASVPGIYLADGLRLDLTSIETGVATGDAWLIQPTRSAASEFTVAISDPGGISAAAPVYAELGDVSTGDLTIEAVRAVDTTHPNLFDRVIVTYDAVNDEFAVTDGNGGPVVDDFGSPIIVSRNSDAGGITAIAANGWELAISGMPDDGDELVVDTNVGREGDNRNLLEMIDLASERLIENRATFQEGYNTILAEIGTQTRQAQIARDSSTVIVENVWAQREAISGVNLDEEAANMLRYQQAYQAAAQAINVSNSMFDTLLNAVRR